LVKNKKFGKNQYFGQKLKVWSKIISLVKNQYFSLKKCWSKIKIVVKNKNVGQI